MKNLQTALSQSIEKDGPIADQPKMFDDEALQRIFTGYERIPLQPIPSGDDVKVQLLNSHGYESSHVLETLPKEEIGLFYDEEW